MGFFVQVKILLLAQHLINNLVWLHWKWLQNITKCKAIEMRILCLSVIFPMLSSPIGLYQHQHTEGQCKQPMLPNLRTCFSHQTGLTFLMRHRSFLNTKKHKSLLTPSSTSAWMYLCPTAPVSLPLCLLTTNIHKATVAQQKLNKTVDILSILHYR